MSSLNSWACDASHMSRFRYQKNGAISEPTIRYLVPRLHNENGTGPVNANALQKVLENAVLSSRQPQLALSALKTHMSAPTGTCGGQQSSIISAIPFRLIAGAATAYGADRLYKWYQTGCDQKENER